MLANIQIKKYAQSENDIEQLIAAVGIYTKVGTLIIQPRQAVYFGFISILGFNVGAKLYTRVLQLLKHSFWLIVLLILFLTILVCSLSTYLVRLFVEEQFVEISSISLILGVFGYPFGGPLLLCSGFYQMERKPMIASLFLAVRLVLCIVLELLIPVWFDVKYVFFAFSIGDIITGVVGIVLFWVVIYRKYGQMLREQTVVKQLNEKQNIVVAQQQTEKDLVGQDVQIEVVKAKVEQSQSKALEDDVGVNNEKVDEKIGERSE